MLTSLLSIHQRWDVDEVRAVSLPEELCSYRVSLPVSEHFSRPQLILHEI